MREGFPKKITTRKVHRGLYEITRDDGYQIKVLDIGRCWIMYSGITTRPRLRTFQYDMRHGFMPHDQVADQ